MNETPVYQTDSAKFTQISPGNFEVQEADPLLSGFWPMRYFSPDEVTALKKALKGKPSSTRVGLIRQELNARPDYEKAGGIMVGIRFESGMKYQIYVSKPVLIRTPPFKREDFNEKDLALVAAELQEE